MENNRNFGWFMHKLGGACLRALHDSDQADTATHDYYHLAGQVPLDMNLPGGLSDNRLSVKYLAKRRYPRQMLMRGTALAVAFLIIGSGLFVADNYMKLQRSFKGSSNAAALSAYVNPNLLKGESSGRINVLILGRDGNGYKNADQTNTVIVASIDAINHKVTMFSLPGNLWVTVPQEGVMTLNKAWQSSIKLATKSNNRFAPVSNPSTQALQTAWQLTDQSVEDIIGQPIDYNVIVNLKSLSQAVDTVGGISINVTADLSDPTMSTTPGGNPLIVKAGSQILSGAQTLKFVGSKGTTSDNDRMNRQRLVLESLMSKIVAMGTLSDPVKLNSLLSTFSNNVVTDLSINNGARLYGIISDVTADNVSSLDLLNPGQGSPALLNSGIADGQPVTLPVTGLFNYSAIQNFLTTQLKNPFIIKENAKILLLNGTDTPGLATDKANQLKNQGYNIVSAGNTPTSGWTSTTLVDLTHHNNLTKQALENQFKVKAADHLSDTSINTAGADFVIIIGSNDSGTP